MTKRRAVVTGANGGIGSAICQRLLADGTEVRTMDIVGSANAVLDLSADPIPEWFGSDVDICVAVAGVVDTFAPAHSMSTEQWSRDIDVNLTGAFRVIQACLPGMRERRFGRVVAISSVAGRNGASGKVAYAASKAGQHGVIRTIAIEKQFPWSPGGTEPIVSNYDECCSSTHYWLEPRPPEGRKGCGCNGPCRCHRGHD
jgi:NAD(P)-dependent dehydrogenase (short-subunit alcohol dehydrogenase family)